MRKSGFIFKRFQEQNTQSFPAQPIWPLSKPCIGFVCFRSAEEIFTVTAPYRQSILGIWSGDVSDLGIISVVAFNSVQTLSADFSTVLPLQKIRGGQLASFAMEYSEKIEASTTQIFSVDLYWQGNFHNIQIDRLEIVSLAGLWPMPNITVHGGKAFSLLEDKFHEESGNVSEARSIKKTTIVKPPKSIGDGIQDVFLGTDRALSDLEEQTKLSNIVKRLFKQRSVGRGTGKNGPEKGSGSEGTGTSKGPGLAESLAGWVRWHTPLGGGLRKQMSERLSLVEKLINKGDIDSALKLALKLGNSKGLEKVKKRFPLRLPEMRSNLDFDTSSSGFSMPVLGGATHTNIWQRYLKLAEELEVQGDYKRAAYIRSQLLDNHHEAVLTLERGELFGEAAKLSFDSKQNPALTVRLYYKAGKKDEALTLARRSNCFDKLAEDSRLNDSEFHTYVLHHWSSHLIETDQPLRALEVTDDLASSSHGKKPYVSLLNSRKGWLESALALDLKMSAPGELIAIELILRTLLTARWDGSDLDMGMMQDFPNAEINPLSPSQVAFGQFQDIVNGRHPDSVQLFLQGLFRQADKKQIEQAGFWKLPVRKIVDVLTRSLLRHSQSPLTQSDMAQLQRLVHAAPLPVLALDLKKIKNLQGQTQNAPSFLTLEKAQTTRSSKIFQACALFNGAMIVHYDTDRFEHLDRTGKVVWVGNIGDVKAIIPIGASPSVLILRKWGEAETRLTIFDTHKRQFRDIGIIHLVAWHDIISDSQWLVQIDNVVGAIDIGKLFRKEVTLEFLWSVNTTNELQIMAFYQKGQSSSWLTENQSNARFGIKQVWRYENTQNLEELYCQFHFKEHSKAHIDWYWADSSAAHGTMKSLVAGQDTNSFVSIVMPKAQMRQEIIQHAKTRVQNGYTGTDTVIVCDYHRPLVTIANEQGLHILPDRKHRKFHIRCEADVGLRLLYRGFSLESDFSVKTSAANIVLCTDSDGRLIRINIELGRIDIF